MNGTRGRGWFYGQPIVVTSCPSDINYDFTGFEDNKTKIMVTNSYGVAKDCGQLFGAVVIVNYSESYDDEFKELDIPLFLNKSAKFEDISKYQNILIVSDSDTQITDNTTGHYHYLINIDNLRNAIECGRYVARRYNNYDYIRRLTNNVTGVLDEYGIETLVFGTNNTIPSSKATYSFVDRYYNSSTNGYLYKGLPGCNSNLLCNYTRDQDSATVPRPIRLDNISSDKFYLGDLNRILKKQ